jgi:AcrR family transcriptional regulator
MNKEIDLKNKILKRANELFNQFGFNKVTMKEIADDMGMSKKTLYKFFEGKEQIVREIIDSIRCNVDNYLEELWADENLDFIEKMSSMMKFIRSQVPSMKSPLAEDLKKNNPELWNEVVETRKKYVRDKYSRVLREGIKNGDVRNEVYEEVVMLMYMNAIHNIMVPDVLSELPLNPEQVFDTITSVLFLGIFTEEGRKKYKQHMLEEEHKSNN